MARPCLLYENSFLFDYLHIYFQAILGHSWAGRLIFGDLAPISLRTYQNNPALAHHAPTKSETSVVSSSPPKQTLPHPRPAEPIWSLARLLALRRVPRSSSAMADQSARSDHSGAPRFPSLLPLLLCLSISVTLALDGLWLRAHVCAG
jgi:hypothetical protein